MKAANKLEEITEGQPRFNPELVKKKEEIVDFLSQHSSEIELQLCVFVDECHLMGGDVCGYVWGQNTRIDIPIKKHQR